MNSFPSKRQSNQKGQGMLVAVMLTFFVGAVTAGLLYQSERTDHFLKGPRIRSAMMSAYNQMRLSSMNADSYDCTPAPCKLRTGPNQAFSAGRLNQVIPYAACGPSGGCGIKVLNPTLVTPADPVAGIYRVTATIRYDGTDLRIPDFAVDFQVPKDVVQLAGKSCSPATPLFVGFSTDGLPNCKALPTGCSATGEYVKSFDNLSLKLNCGTLQSTYVGCGPNEYMTQLKWAGGVFAKSCAPRKDPMTLPGGPFPLTVLGAAATTNSPGPSPQTTCTTTTTTTTTTSTTTTTVPGPTTTTTTVPSSTTTTTTTSTTTTTLGAGHCEVPDKADPSVTRGWGVTACTSDGAPFGVWGGNTCKLAATGMKCCGADFTVSDFHAGEQNSYPVGTDPSVYWIGLKCVSYSYCSGNSSRCVTRPSEQSTKPSSPPLYEYFDF